MLHFYDDGYASPGAGWSCTDKHLTSVGIVRGLSGVKGNVGLANNVQGWVCYADCPVVFSFLVFMFLFVCSCLDFLHIGFVVLLFSDMSWRKIPHGQLYGDYTERVFGL